MSKEYELISFQYFYINLSQYFAFNRELITTENIYYYKNDITKTPQR